MSLLVILFFAANVMPWRYSVSAAAATVVMLSLHGCCEAPELQLPNWSPGTEEFKHRAGNYDEAGTWQGNPTWSFTPEHEAEHYHCVAQHSNRSVCMVWTAKEWNCLEEDFGICKCYELPEVGNYCAAWGCHMLEADQHICYLDEGAESCQYDRFEMNERVYNQMMEQTASGLLTTGEVVNWWEHSAWPTSHGRRTAADSFPPHFSRGIETHQDGDVCRSHGDNSAFVMETCSRWREIETEVQQCRCTEVELETDVPSCASWTCEERDMGLFSVLFRTEEMISRYIEGSEMETYSCHAHDQTTGRCTVWEGDIESLEEVEWARCECADASCDHWVCDEYEQPVRRDIWELECDTCSIWRPIVFMIIECLLSCVNCVALGDNEFQDFAVKSFGVWCCVIVTFPFLFVTFGVEGFLMLAFPFWILRFCICCCFAGGKVRDKYFNY